MWVAGRITLLSVITRNSSSCVIRRTPEQRILQAGVHELLMDRDEGEEVEELRERLRSLCELL